MVRGTSRSILKGLVRASYVAMLYGYGVSELKETTDEIFRRLVDEHGEDGSRANVAEGGKEGSI